VTIDRITLPALINPHDHLRDLELMAAVMKYIARGYCIIIGEPNLKDPILTPKGMIAYHDRVCRERDRQGLDVEFYFLFQVLEDTTPATVRQFSKLPYCIGGKSYYYKTTTNSEIGIKSPMAPKNAYLEMGQRRLRSQHHGEMPRLGQRISWVRSEGVFFTEVAPRLVDELPDVPLDFQHLSTSIAVNFVREAPENVTGGFTLAHMEKTMDDVEGYLLQPENFMKPHPKDYPDLDAIEEAALNPGKKFHPTPDNAPHLRRNKTCVGGCAGGFAAPVIPEGFINWFVERGATEEQIRRFLCDNPYRTYGIPVPDQQITFVRKEWDVPESYPTEIEGPGSDLIPYKRGEKVSWQIEGQEAHYNR
jgi:dihydroorotase